MTLKRIKSHASHDVSEVGVWHCSHCASFHVKAGEVLLTFSKAEFAAFSNTVFNCYSDALTIDDVRGAGHDLNDPFEIEAMGLAH